MDKIMPKSELPREAYFVEGENGKLMLACGNCHCFRPNAATNGQGGDCHFNPPTVVVMSAPGGMDGRGAVVMRQSINTVFSPVPKTEMCFRFAPYPDLVARFKAEMN